MAACKIDIKIILGSHAHPDHQSGDAMVERLDEGWKMIRATVDIIPPRMASFSALLRNDAFTTRSTVTGQLKGTSVP